MFFADPAAARRRCSRTPRPGPAQDSPFTDPRQLAGLLSGAGWQDITIDAVREPAWMGSDVADVMRYVRGLRLVRNLAAGLGNETLTGQALADLAEQYAARQRADGIWVQAAAWLVTARCP